MTTEMFTLICRNFTLSYPIVTTYDIRFKLFFTVPATYQAAIAALHQNPSLSPERPPLSNFAQESVRNF